MFSKEEKSNSDRALAGIACFVAVVVLNKPASAYEDADCIRQETVPVAVEEAFGKWSEMDAARQRALDRTNQDAIRRVVGVNVTSSRESRAEIWNSDAEQRFKQLEQTSLAGLVRLKILEESRKSTDDGGSLSIKSEVTVCVPKSQAMKKEEQERTARQQRPPKPVDPITVAWFDPVTGQPQVWYWREGQTFEFFDNSGFHPRTGDKLLIVDRKIVNEWQQLAERVKREETERAQRQIRMAQAGEQCDQTAAGPYDLDRSKSAPGVPMDVLRNTWTDAVEACGLAAQRFPDERRYRYQLARAYQASDPKKALPLLQILVRQNYRAAFDNYGWALVDTRIGRIDRAGALATFRRGAELGDPSAMVSLAGMISSDRGEAVVSDEALKLYRRAASLGHRGAADAVDRLTESQRHAEQKRLQNEEAARAFMGILGGAVGGIGRRY